MPIDPMGFHRAAIAELSRRQLVGEITEAELMEESMPHASAVAALEMVAERQAMMRWVEFARRNPALMEAVAIGLAHFLRSMGDRPTGDTSGEA